MAIVIRTSTKSQLPYGGKQVLRQDCDGKLIYEGDMSQLPYGGNKSYDKIKHNVKKISF